MPPRPIGFTDEIQIFKFRLTPSTMSELLKIDHELRHCEAELACLLRSHESSTFDDWKTLIVTALIRYYPGSLEQCGYLKICSSGNIYELYLTNETRDTLMKLGYQVKTKNAQGAYQTLTYAPPETAAARMSSYVSDFIVSSSQRSFYDYGDSWR